MHQRGHRDHRYTGAKVSAHSATHSVLPDMRFPFMHFVFVGIRGALYFSEGDTSTSGEAAGGERGGPAAAEGAEGASGATV